MIQPHSNIIALDQHGTGQILLRDIRTPCLFKIKTNVPNAVETKPAYGIIKEEGVGGRKIAVRYKGNITDVQKVAVKVCMLPITAEEANIDSSQILGKYREIKQSGKTKQFRSEQQSQMRQFRYKKQDFIKNNRKSIEIKTVKQQNHLKNSGNFQKNIERQQQTITENLSTYNCNTLAAFILTLAFLIGVVIGVKSSPYLSYLRSIVAQSNSL